MALGFGSILTSLSRLVADIDAVISTALQIDIARRDTSPDQARKARFFPVSVDNRSLLLMALMADAGDEVLVLIRLFDSEDCDASLTAVKVQTFIDRIAYLFI